MKGVQEEREGCTAWVHMGKEKVKQEEKDEREGEAGGAHEEREDEKGGAYEEREGELGEGGQQGATNTWWGDTIYSQVDRTSSLRVSLPPYSYGTAKRTWWRSLCLWCGVSPGLPCCAW